MSGSVRYRPGSMHGRPGAQLVEVERHSGACCFKLHGPWRSAARPMGSSTSALSSPLGTHPSTPDRSVQARGLPAGPSQTAGSSTRSLGQREFRVHAGVQFLNLVPVVGVDLLSWHCAGPCASGPCVSGPCISHSECSRDYPSILVTPSSFNACTRCTRDCAMRSLPS